MNNIQDLIKEIMQFCQEDTQELIAKLEQQRFANQGEFNGHEKWKDNQSIKHPCAQKSVIQDKGRNEPLVDSGYLKKQLSTASNWDLKPQISDNTMRLSIPQRENFTAQKYDKLDVGVDHFVKYISPRGNIVAMDSIPARPFKDISDQDVNWVVNKLIEDIKGKFQ